MPDPFAGVLPRRPHHMTTRVAAVGEVMLELSLDDADHATLGVAGDTYNSAVYLARTQVAPVDYVTVLGRDTFSGRIRSHMKRHGVGTTRIMTHPTRAPGLYAIETDAKGERRFAYWRDTSAARCLGDTGQPAIDTLFDGLTHIILSGISLAILPPDNRDRLFAALTTFRARGGCVIFDSNYRQTLWEDAQTARAQIAKAWDMCDIALPSLDDELALFGDRDTDAVLARFASYGVQHGALKRGADGPLGLDGTALATVDKPEHVVDTTAAGDSFNAGYLAGLLKGLDQQDAMRAGHALALRVITHRGAIVPK